MGGFSIHANLLSEIIPFGFNWKVPWFIIYPSPTKLGSLVDKMAVNINHASFLIQFHQKSQSLKFSMVNKDEEFKQNQQIITEISSLNSKKTMLPMCFCR